MSNKTIDSKANIKTITKINNCKNKKMTNYSLKSNSIKKNSNSCPSNIIKYNPSSKNSNRNNSNPIKKYSSYNKILNFINCPNPTINNKIFNKKILLSINSNPKTDNLNTNLILYKATSTPIKPSPITKNSNNKNNPSLSTSNSKSSNSN